MGTQPKSANTSASRTQLGKAGGGAGAAAGVAGCCLGPRGGGGVVARTSANANAHKVLCLLYAILIRRGVAQLAQRHGSRLLNLVLCTRERRESTGFHLRGSSRCAAAHGGN